MRDMYRKLPQIGGTPREVSEVVNNTLEGKTNNTGEITLNTGWATTTTIYNERIGYNSIILLTPTSVAAGSDKLPYGAFQDSSNQFTTANTPTVVLFNTTDFENGVYLSSNKIYARNAGVYNYQFSLQFSNTDSQIQEVEVWLRKNGTNIAGTSSKYAVPNKHGSIDGYLIAVANFFVDLAAGDYLELVWATTLAANSGGTVTGVYMEAYASSTSPYTRPSVPSAVATLQYNQASASTNVYVSSKSQGQATLTHFANNTLDKTYGYIVVA